MNRRSFHLLVLGLTCLALAQCGRIGFDACPAGAACIVGVSINANDEYARGPLLTATVTVSGDAPFEVRVAEALGSQDCSDVFADDNWHEQLTITGSYDVLVEPIEGRKRVCAWVRDADGDVSGIRGEGREHLDMDTIEYSVRNPPQVVSFSVVSTNGGGRIHSAGGPMTASWEVTDVEGLAAAPIRLEYTESSPDDPDGWEPLVATAGEGTLADNGRRSIGSLSIAAPSANPFLVRVLAYDKAGNRSIAGESDVQNAPNWSVFAGVIDRGVGGPGRIAKLLINDNKSHEVAVDPRTHTVFAIDSGHGVVRLDSRTGDVETFIYDGPSNFPDDGPLPARPQVTVARLGMDDSGNLYVAIEESDDETMASAIYRINPTTRNCTRVVGGDPMGAPEDSSPLTVHVISATWNVSTNGDIYFLSSCDAANRDTASYQLVRANMGSDGVATSLDILAGACSGGTSFGPNALPTDALSVDLGEGRDSIGSVAVINDGEKIYIGRYGTSVRKIIGGRIHNSDIEIASGGSLAYDRFRDRLIVADDAIHQYQPGATGDDEDVFLGDLLASEDSAGCVNDGVLASAACGTVAFGMAVTPERVYFVDGGRVNERRPYRVRFVDSAGDVQTYLGAPAFYGEGLDRRLARSAFRGIGVKQATDPNQSAFSAGVYFVDDEALLMGQFRSSDDVTQVIWGSQSNMNLPVSSGMVASDTVSFGVAYGAGNARSLAFDEQGLPWSRIGTSGSDAALVSLTASREIVFRQTGSDIRWDESPIPLNAANVNLWPYGAISNLTLHGMRAYLYGGYEQYTDGAIIRSFDFATSEVLHLIGNNNAFSPDRLVPGSVTTASVSGCLNGSHCFTRYRADDVRLYFSEQERMRYITNPDDPSLSTLVTDWVATSSINNFTFRPGSNQVLYITGNQLRCHDPAATSSWCNDSPIEIPVVLSTLNYGSDQFAWQDNNTLLISTYSGQILQYTIPN